MTMYKTKVNAQFDFDLDEKQLTELDVVHTNDEYHVLEHGLSYAVNIIAEDLNRKKYTVLVNGQTYEVSIENALDQRINAMGFALSSAKQIDHVKAPMPGLILDILVKEGDEINENDPLLILEAMKMENSLVSPRAGTIKSVSVIRGATVDKGDLLVEFIKE